MFQGGFVGTECDLIMLSEYDEDKKVVGTIFPEDINDLQVFKLPETIPILSTHRFQLQFKKSSDFYGRITVYIVHLGGQTN